MTAPVAVSSHPAACRREGGGAGAINSRLPRRTTRNVRHTAAAAAIFKSTGRSSAIFVAGAFARVFRGRLGIGMPCGVRGAVNHGQPVPINFSRPFEASGGLIPSRAALIELRQKSASCCADAFHVQNSLSDAPASELHRNTGAHGNARKAFGEIRNVEC